LFVTRPGCELRLKDADVILKAAVVVLKPPGVGLELAEAHGDGLGAWRSWDGLGGGSE
jgi:hypothetical protein